MELDLIVDLNTEDDTGLPWKMLRNARYPERVVRGAYIVVGSASVRAHGPCPEESQPPGG